MIIDPEKYAHEYELDAKSMIDCGEESAPVSIVSMRLWLRAAHAVVELTGPSGSDGKTFGSDGSVSLWLHESDLALGNILLNRISSENDKLRKLVQDLWFAAQYLGMNPDGATGSGFARQMRELGIEV